MGASPVSCEVTLKGNLVDGSTATNDVLRDPGPPPSAWAHVAFLPERVPLVVKTR